MLAGVAKRTLVLPVLLHYSRTRQWTYLLLDHEGPGVAAVLVLHGTYLWIDGSLVVDVHDDQRFLSRQI